MAYAPLPAKGAGETINLANYDNIRDNFAAGVPDLFTTKGDIAAATAADVATRLGVGADDTVLVADSGEATGLIWQIQPAARVYNNANIDPAQDAWVALTFNSERYDTDASHHATVNTNRLTVPANGDGLYHIGGNVEFDTDGAAQGGETLGLQVRLNGATVLAQTYWDIGVNGDDVSVGISTDYTLVATDYVELLVYTDNDFEVVANGNFSPEFWFHWFRRP